MYKSFYQDFLKANPKLVHMAAHSHHYWPDVAKEAVLASYEDSKNLADLKWEKILGEVVPKSQELIARILNLSKPENISFASNTHELLIRLISCFPMDKPLRILTTDSEFHSAARQFKRLDELKNVHVNFFEAEKEDFAQHFLNEIKSGGYDLIFVSHVFFNSGKALSFDTVKSFVQAKSEKTIFCLDGYHSFCALPLDLSELEKEIFFLAGSYKYAQAGEGMCFMTIPENCQLRPVNTGWFANFEGLEKQEKEVGYAKDGWRFAGSTRDFTAHYRFNFIWEDFLKKDLSVVKIHDHIQELQSEFLTQNKLLERFTNTDLSSQGHFLTLKTGSHKLSERLYNHLKDNFILVDYRGERLRFGFGLYLSFEDVKKVRAFINGQEFHKMFLKNSLKNSD